MDTDVVTTTNAKEPRMLTQNEAAALLHVQRETLMMWSSQGRIQAYRVSPDGDLRFRVEDVARLMSDRESPERHD